MHLLVTGTFRTRGAAEEAIRRLEDIGVTGNQISLLMSEETRARDWQYGDDDHIGDADNTDEGAAAGAVTGGLLGAVMGAVTTAGAVMIPGLNIIVSGAVLSSIAGALIGAGGGGLLGALIGAGLSEPDAKAYEQELKSGAIVLAVRADNIAQKEQIRRILEEGDASNLSAFSSEETSGLRPGA